MRLFEISRSKKVDEFSEKIVKSTKQFFELDLGIDWGLSKGSDHLNFKIRDNYYLWVTAKRPFNIPQLRILYKVDSENESVEIINIDVI
ncbi:hypothetical protein [Saccharicrinis sp. FJH54]|uniref:hypothetical protein n=1 Tax=Saccharicrinis sp. FJH54 TaxID=3344665 RepID=UPI0035D48E30